MKWIALEGAGELLEYGVKAILPHDMRTLRRWEFDELTQLDVYAQSVSFLQASDAQFQLSAGSIGTDPAFDFAKARKTIDDQQMQVQRINGNELIPIIVLPKPEDGFTGVMLPLGQQAWLLNHAVLSFLGGSKKVATTIQIGSGAIAVGSAITGIGAGVAAAAGTVSVGAGRVSLSIGIARLPIRWLGALVYGLNLKAWAQDMLSIPLAYTTTRSLLEVEAVTPRYLRSDASFSGSATLDLNEDYTIFGTSYITTNILSPFLTLGLADVDVRNTGSTTSTFRVAATGWWDYKLPGDWWWVGQTFFGGVTLIKVPVSVWADRFDIAPGQTYTFHVPYVGVLLDPVNAFSPHWFQVDVYSGPYVVKTMSMAYYVVPGVFTTATGDSVVAPYELTYVRDGAARSVSAADFGDLAGEIVPLIDSELSAAQPQLEMQFPTPDAWSMAIELHSDPTSGVELRVYDDAGLCLGFDSSHGGVQQEFPGEFAGAGSRQQTVIVPSLNSTSYRVVAALEGAASADPVPVRAWLLKTPARPAVMGLSPSSFVVKAYWGEVVSIPMTVAEVGGQMPLDNVDITVSDFIGADGQTTLTLASEDQQSFGVVAAGHAQEVSLSVSVPRGVPSGPYSATVSSQSANAGGQLANVQVRVLPMGDFDADEDVDLADYAALAGDTPGCLRGPGGDSLPLGCSPFDFDGDGDVDLRDFAVWQNAFTGP